VQSGCNLIRYIREEEGLENTKDCKIEGFDMADIVGNWRDAVSKTLTQDELKKIAADKVCEWPCVP
jgi:hypothetical protein